MPAPLKQSPIHPQDSMYQSLLHNLQGNILQAHRGMHALHMFLKFTTSDAEKARRWLRAFVDGQNGWPIPSAHAQLTEACEGLFCNVFLSATGYKALGFPEEQLKKRFRDTEEDTGKPGRLQFVGGMAAHARLLGDPCPTTWDDPYQGRKIDVMLLLAHNSLETLNTRKEDIQHNAAEVAKVLAVECGHRLRRGKKFVEPFGYVDGISQPRFFLTSHGDFAPLDLVLLQDPLAPPEVEDCYGSYLVFRKLEQNVSKFHEQIVALAENLQCDIAMARAIQFSAEGLTGHRSWSNKAF